MILAVERSGTVVRGLDYPLRGPGFKSRADV